MKLFDIFKKRKKMSIKELYSPVLDEMWVCTFNFRPWDPSEHQVVFKKVKIVKAEANSEGIYVRSSEPYPFYRSDDRKMQGYIDKIKSDWYWTGFFETEEDAKNAYRKLMEEWIGVIKKGVDNASV